MDWEPQGIRFVLYPAVPGALPEAQEVWKYALPDREAGTIQRPQATTPGVSQSLASGSARGIQLTFTVQQARLDFLAGRAEPWMADQGRPLGLDELLQPALVYGGKCVDRFPCMRVALVLDLVAAANDWTDAAAKFHQALPEIPMPGDTREIVWAINATRRFGSAPDIVMNRICKWETALFHYMMIPTGPGGGAPSLMQQRHALALQFDLSSEVRGAALENGHAKAMLDELGDEIGLLVAQGYQRLCP